MTVRDDAAQTDGYAARIAGTAPAEKGNRYIRQLAKHWSHKFAVSETDGEIHIAFKIGGIARLSADDQRIVITIEAADRKSAEQLKDVVAVHLNRFAFREAPLEFSWKAPV